MENRRLERDVDSAKDTFDALVIEIGELESKLDKLQDLLQEKEDKIEELEDLISELKDN